MKHIKHFLTAGSLLLFAFIVFTASFLRSWNLNSIPVFADEAIYIRWSQVMKAEETLRFLPLSDGKQPLFMWMVIPFLKIISDPLIAGRMVSVIAGVGSLFGIFVLTQLLFGGKKISFLSTIIYAVLPFSVFFDRFALADGLLSFFGVWTLIFTIITVKKIRLDSAMLAGFALGGALLTKSPGIYFAILIPFTLLLAEWPKNIRAKFTRLCVYVFLFTFTYAIGFGLQNILRLGPNFHMIALRNMDYVYPVSHLLSSPFDPLKPFLIRNFQYIWNLGTPVFVLLLIVGIYNGLKSRKLETLVLLLWSLAPIFISSEFSKTMTARYIYPSLIYLTVLASLAVMNIANKNITKLVYALIGGYVMLSLGFDILLLTDPQKLPLPRSERSGYLEEWTSGYGIKEISEYLKTESASHKIVVGTEGYFGTLPDGLQIYMNDFPAVTVIGVGEPVRELPSSLKESVGSGNDTYLVVNNTRLLTDPNKIGLTEVRSFQKAVKPDGSYESLQLFKLSK